MMKVKDLRIGNLIADNDKTISIVMGLPPDGFVQYSCKLNGQIYGEPVEWFKPITLTEEWLIKFGFEYRSRTKYYVKNNIYLFIGETEETFGKIIIADCRAYQGEYIEYVHQLQNLYFALTGEELKIK